MSGKEIYRRDVPALEAKVARLQQEVNRLKGEVDYLRQAQVEQLARIDAIQVTIGTLALQVPGLSDT